MTHLHHLLNIVKKKTDILILTYIYIYTYLESALAMVAPETCLVVNFVVSSKTVDKVHGLVTGFALLGCSSECHFCWIWFFRERERKMVEKQ